MGKPDRALLCNPRLKPYQGAGGIRKSLGLQRPQQSLKIGMTLNHDEHPVIYWVLQWAQVCLAAFNHAETNTTGRNQGDAVQPQRRRAALRPHPSSKGIYFFGSEKEGKQQDLLILSCVSPVPQDLRSLTPGHRISTAEDQPHITGVCRKLGLMGGPRSEDGVWRLTPSDQRHPLSQLLLGQAQSPGPFGGTNPTGWVKHIGVHPRGVIWDLPWGLLVWGGHNTHLLPSCITTRVLGWVHEIG